MLTNHQKFSHLNWHRILSLSPPQLLFSLFHPFHLWCPFPCKNMSSTGKKCACGCPATVGDKCACCTKSSTCSTQTASSSSKSSSSCCAGGSNVPMATTNFRAAEGCSCAKQALQTGKTECGCPVTVVCSCGGQCGKCDCHHQTITKVQ